MDEESYGIFDWSGDANAIHFRFSKQQDQFYLTTTFLSIDTFDVSFSEGKPIKKTSKYSVKKKQIFKEDWLEIRTYFKETNFWSLAPFENSSRFSNCCSFTVNVFDAWRKQQLASFGPCFIRIQHSVIRSCNLSAVLQSLWDSIRDKAQIHQSGRN